MNRTLAAAALAVILGCASPAEAQTLASSTQASVVMERRSVAAGKAARVVAIMTGITNDPRFRSARTPAEFAGLLDEKAPLITAGRTELQAIAAELSALPPVAQAGDDPTILLADHTIDQTADFARMADGILGRMEELHAAAAAGDRNRMMAAGNTMIESAALSLDYQAMVFRNAERNFAPDSSDFALNSVAACFYDGVAAYQRGAFALIPADVALSQMRASTACVRTHASSGRAALAKEAENSEGGFEQRMVEMQLGLVTGRIIDAFVDGAAELNRAADDFERHGASPTLATRYMPALMAIEGRVKQAQQEEDRIIREANSRAR